MTDTWLIHEHKEAPCGCRVTVSMYDTIDGDAHANGQDLVTFMRCAGHGARRVELEFPADETAPEPGVRISVAHEVAPPPLVLEIPEYDYADDDSRTWLGRWWAKRHG